MVPQLNPNQIRVVAGEHDLNIYDELGEQVRNVSKIIIHPGWSSVTLNNDIAILVLEEPLQFDDYTRPIDIAKGDEIQPGK